MLTRLDDAIIDHDKVEEAAKRLGRNGYFVALGAVAWAICYSNKKLTDGYIPARALERYGVSEAMANALVAADLWEAAEDGYRVHDFHDWNPSSSAVKDKRRRDRERKRAHAGFRAESSVESHSASERSRSHAHAGAPADQDRTGRVSYLGPRRRHALDEVPDASVDPESCERAERFLADFVRWHVEIRDARYVPKFERDWPEALRLVGAYNDRELEAIARLYLAATGVRYDNEPRSPGRLRDAAGEMEKRLKEAGQWPSAA